MAPIAPFREFQVEHRRVRRLMRSMLADVARRRRGRLAGPALDRIRQGTDTLAYQFATHMTTEEQVLYPALAPELPDGVARLSDLREEHRDLRSMLGRLHELLRAPADVARDEQIVVQVRDLAELLELHIEKEEAAVFGLVARVLGPRDLARVALRVATRRDDLERRLHSRRVEKGADS